MLLQEVLARLQLEPVSLGSAVYRSVFGGERISHRTTVKTLQAGDLKYSPLHAGVFPGATGKRLLGEDDASPILVDGRILAGSLGTEILTRTDFELDLAHGKLRLFSPRHCRGMGAYWTTGFAKVPFDRDATGGIFFGMQLDGRTVEATLDTLDGVTSLDSDITRRLWGFDEKDTGEPTVDERGERAHYRAMALTMPGLEAYDVRIRLFSRNGECGYRERIDSGTKAVAYGKCLGTFPLTVGRDLLGDVRIYFSIRERTIYLSSSDAGT